MTVMNDDLMIGLVKLGFDFLTIDRLLWSLATIILSIVKALAPITAT